MATQNFTVGSTWVRIAADTDDPLLISCEARAVVEFGTTATDADPGAGVKGHRLMMGDGFALSRASGIVGWVSAKVASGTPSVVLAVDGSSETPA
jgi:hypothetical protein